MILPAFLVTIDTEGDNLWFNRVLSRQGMPSIFRGFRRCARNTASNQLILQIGRWPRVLHSGSSAMTSSSGERARSACTSMHGTPLR